MLLRRKQCRWRAIHVATLPATDHGHIVLPECLTTINDYRVYDPCKYVNALDRQGNLKDALDRLQQQGCNKDVSNHACILQLCVNSRALSEGKQVHAHVLRNGLGNNVFLANLLVTLYGKCSSVPDARLVFNSMIQRCIVSWNTMISAYMQQELHAQALILFHEMQLEEVNLNRISFVMVLGACSSFVDLAEGRLIHGAIVGSEFESDTVVGTAIVKMYGSTGSLEEAENNFHKMQRLDIVSWNVMIATYIQHGLDHQALLLFQKLRLAGVTPDKITFMSLVDSCTALVALLEGKLLHAYIVNNRIESDVCLETALIDMYSKCGDLENACTVFYQMHKKNIVTWTVMIAAYSYHGYGENALELFHQMRQSNLKPDRVTFVCLLDACSNLAALEEGSLVHHYITHSGLQSDIVIGNAIINMYAKCGSLKDAQKMFDRMCARNLVSWTAMIAAYAQHGHGEDALHYFQLMQQEGIKPDSITFINLLSACSHAGLLNDSCQQFLAMSGDYGIIPTSQHYRCLIDMLGRAGWLEEMEDLFHKMTFGPDLVSLMTFVGAR